LTDPPLLSLARLRGSSGTGSSRGDERCADVKLDLGLVDERDVARVALVDLAVVEGGDAALRRTDLVSAERQAPLVEEVPERKAPPDRRLEVDDAVGDVRVQPVNLPNRCCGAIFTET
jgi:hypothetical protein